LCDIYNIYNHSLTFSQYAYADGVAFTVIKIYAAHI